MALIRQVRASEAADPACLRWARNKCSDDATASTGCAGWPRRGVNAAGRPPLW